MNMTCDRCKKDFDGEKGEGFTAGYYEVGPTGLAWGRYANPGENVICDACMWADPRYVSVYGNLLKNNACQHPDFFAGAACK